jgi:uncharacterized protein (TIGR02001 family)
VATLGRCLHLALVLLLAGIASPCAAQFGASITALTDDRFRGRSLSNGDPVARLDLSYDDRSGIYVAGAMTLAATSGAVRLLSGQGNLGYSLPIGPGAALDLGAIHSEYSEYYSGGVRSHYTDFYAGLVTEKVSVHLHYSPQYFQPGYASLYADVNATVRLDPKWRLIAHGGITWYVDKPLSDPRDPTQLDWKLSIVRQTGPFDLQLALSGCGPDADYYGEARHNCTALVFGATYIF